MYEFHVAMSTDQRNPYLTVHTKAHCIPNVCCQLLHYVQAKVERERERVNKKKTETERRRRKRSADINCKCLRNRIPTLDF